MSLTQRTKSHHKQEKKKIMKKNKKPLLLIIFLLSSLHPINAYNQDDYKDFYKKHPYPYLEYNVKIIATVAAQFFSILGTLQSKHCFTNAEAQEVNLIKEIAKELHFPQKDIDGLQVKRPVKHSYFDKIFRNNFAAFFKTIILGRQDHEIFAPIVKEPNVKKFIYGHELSHVKYKHSQKMCFYTLLSPIIIHTFMTGLSKYFKYRTKNINTRRASNTVKSAVTVIPKILESFITKFFVQISVLILMKKKFEVDADMGAASLGPDSTKGGIRFFKALADIQDTKHNDIVNYFDSTIVKYMIKFTLNIQYFFRRIFAPHASAKKRAQYLEKVLERQLKEQKT